MSNQLDDLPLLPQVPRAPSDGPGKMPEAAPLIKIEAQDFSARPGDHDDGEARVKQAPQELKELTKADWQKELTAFEQELRQADELMVSEPTAFGLSSLLGHPLVGIITLGMAGLLGLFLFNQVSSTIAVIQNMTGPTQWLAWGVFGVLTGLVVYAIIRFAWLYMRLRRNRQLRLQGLEELEKRTKMRWLINAKRHEAYQQLESYLREYPLDTPRARKKLNAVGVTGEILLSLTDARGKLVERDRWPDASKWFDGFRDTFQSKLDEVAKTRINYWARRAAFATAVSPNALADSGLTLYFSFSMISDLCTIYNLRVGRLGTMVLLSRVFFNSYLSGQMNEAEGWTSDQISQLIEPHLPASELLLGKIFSKVSVKASAGAINFLLISRLGKYACRHLRPVNAN